MASAKPWLGLAKDGLGAVPIAGPGLSAAIGMLITIIDIFEKVKANEEEKKKLYERISTIRSIIESTRPNTLDPSSSYDKPLLVRLEKLARNISSCKEDFEKLENHSRFFRIIGSDDIANSVKSVNAIIEDAVKMFELEGGIRREIILNQHSTKFDEHEIILHEQTAKIDAQNANLENYADAAKRDSILRNFSRNVRASFEVSAAPSCLDGTRSDLLQELHDWATQIGEQYAERRVAWLRGPPGTGKSTVTKTMAERLHKEETLAASFFFSRDYAERSNPKAVFPTIAYQLCCFSSEFAHNLDKARSKYPEAEDSPIETQFERLFVEPLEGVTAANKPWVIIFDALDECDGQAGRSSTVRLLKVIASKLDRIPKNIRFLVASRPEPAISLDFSDHKLKPFTHVIRIDEIDGPKVAADIRRYLAHALQSILEEAEVQEKDIEALTNVSDGLFIYAATLVKLIQEGEDEWSLPSETLQQVIQSTHGGGASPLGALYIEILQRLFRRAQPRSVEDYQQIVGAIVHLRNPLGVSGLAGLLGISPKNVRHILGPLQSVISVPENDDDSDIRFHHQSFRDFIIGQPPEILRENRDHLDQEKFASLFFFDNTTYDLQLAEYCLQRMSADLHQNMLHLDNTFQSNADLPDDFRSKIPSYTRYACLYWTSHLDATNSTTPNPLTEKVETWSKRQMMFWLEVLSLCGELRQAIPRLREALRWCNKESPSPTTIVRELLQDCERFVAMFYTPIQRSAGHIYHSALPFTPDSQLYKLYHTFPMQSVKVLRGRSLEWPPLQWTAEGHSDWVNSVAFSPDGEHIVSGSHDKTVRVWSSNSGELLRTLEGHLSAVMSVAFSPDGQHIVSGSDDKTVRVWSSNSGELLRTLEGHSGWSVAFSPDGQYIVSGSDDRTVRVWSSNSGELLRTLEGHSNWVKSVAFSPDGQHIVSGSDDKTVRVWSSSSGELLRTLEGHSDLVNSVAFSPDGQHIVSGSSNKTVWVWSSNSGELLRTLEGHSGWSVAFSPDGQYIVSGSDDRTVRVWSSNSGELLRTLGGHSGWVWSVAFSPDGQHIVVGASDTRVRVWSSNSGELLRTLEGHSNWVKSVAFSPDGQHIVSGSDDKTVRVWSSSSGELLRTLEGHSDLVNSVAFSPDGQHIVSGSSNKTVWVWSSNSGELLRTLEGHSDWVKSVAFSPDGQHIVSGSDDRTVRVWSPNSGELLRAMEGHSDWVRSVAFSPDGEHIVSGSDDRTVRVWSSSSGELLRTLEGHSDWVRSVAFSPDGEHIMSGSDDRTVRVWSSSSGELLRTLEGHPDLVNSIAFSVDGQTILTFTMNGAMRQWHVGQEEQEVDVASGNLIIIKDGWVILDDRSLCWVPLSNRGPLVTSRHRLSFGSPSGLITILDLSAVFPETLPYLSS